MKWVMDGGNYQAHTFKIGPTEYTPMCAVSLTSRFLSKTTIPIPSSDGIPTSPFGAMRMKTGDELIAEMGLNVAECGREIVPDATKN
jgi:hypothetical protein